MARFKIICVDNGEQEILKEYDDIDKVIYDMQWRNPSFFFIGDEENKMGYTLEQFIDKFKEDDFEDLKITIHDCYVDVYNKKPTESEIENIFNHLPKKIINLADEWGGFDTEVREMTYEWILRQKNNQVYQDYKNKGICYNIDYTDNLEKYKDQLNMMGED